MDYSDFDIKVDITEHKVKEAYRKLNEDNFKNGLLPYSIRCFFNASVYQTKYGQFLVTDKGVFISSKDPQHKVFLREKKLKRILK
jgi:hypothetical protein